MNYPVLLTVDDLKSRLSDPNFQVVQIVSQTQYSKVFIPGAAVITPQELVSGRPPTPGELPSVERLNETLGRIGLDEEKTIVVADDDLMPETMALARRTTKAELGLGDWHGH